MPKKNVGFFKVEVSSHIFLDTKLFLPDLEVRETVKALGVMPC